MVDINFMLWSNRLMRPMNNHVPEIASQATGSQANRPTGGAVMARVLGLKLDLLALGSLLALLIIGRGAGTG
ncbi:MAG TPA: hypothetical protein VI566_13800 [Xanthomonadales bacterium]|nr:hypothetical protein [Xanthomonadales bacterium]